MSLHLTKVAFGATGVDHLRAAATGRLGCQHLKLEHRGRSRRHSGNLRETLRAIESNGFRRRPVLPFNLEPIYSATRAMFV